MICIIDALLSARTELEERNLSGNLKTDILKLYIMSDTSVPSSPDNVAEQVGFPDVTSPSSSRSESPVTVSPKPTESAADDAIRYFEHTYYDEYDYYNLTPENKLFKHASGKGRSKREASKHSSRLPSQWGMLAKFENEANNRKRNVAAKVGRNRSISK